MTLAVLAEGSFDSVYFTALATTVAIEVPIAVLLAPRGARAMTAVIALLLNLLTHPVACAAYWSWGAPWLAVELAVTTVEALGYAVAGGLRVPRACAIAIVANVVTASLS